MRARQPHEISLGQRAMKRALDLIVSTLVLVTTSWLILLLFVIATIDARRNGFLLQTRVGRNGKPFKMIKIRTMRDRADCQTTVTTSHDVRITRIGRVLRRLKLDELPQFLNVVTGRMSLVGPRPDVLGFADRLEGADRITLSIRPGITGPATLRFRDEESLLARQPDPEWYNRAVIYPEKVRLNREYVENYRFGRDLSLIYRTVFGGSEGPGGRASEIG